MARNDEQAAWRPTGATVTANCDYGVDLTADRSYVVLDDPKAEEYGYVRIVDDSGESYLYPAILFLE